MQGFSSIPEKPPTPSRKENRNISGSQKTVLRFLLTPGEQTLRCDESACTAFDHRPYDLP
jgi:hypothetical protein